MAVALLVSRVQITVGHKLFVLFSGVLIDEGLKSVCPFPSAGHQGFRTSQPSSELQMRRFRNAVLERLGSRCTAGSWC